MNKVCRVCQKPLPRFVDVTECETVTTCKDKKCPHKGEGLKRAQIDAMHREVAAEKLMAEKDEE